MPRAEVARVKEEKDGEIDSIKAEKAKVTEELAALVANARPAARPTSLVPVAQGGWVTPLEHSLKICDLEVHDNAPMFPKEPAVPCTGADKPIKIELELTNDAGEKVTPPRGFKVQATLHIEGSHSALTADEVMWAQRLGAAAPKGAAFTPEHRQRGQRVRDEGELLALSAHIYPYSSEVQKRKLVIHFTAVNHESVTPAISIAVNNMSRTPNSRKNKTPPGVPALTYKGRSSPRSAPRSSTRRRRPRRRPAWSRRCRRSSRLRRGAPTRTKSSFRPTTNS